MFRAAEVGNLASVKELVASGVNIHDRDSNNRTAIYYAALNCNLDIVEYLLDMGAYVNNIVCDGTLLDNNKHSLDHERLLHLAAEKGKLSIIKYLIQRRENAKHPHLDVSIDAKGLNNEETALHYAVSYRHIDIVKWLIDKGANVEAKDKSGNTPFHLVGRFDSITIRAIHNDPSIKLENKNIEIMKCLKEAKADINAKDGTGKTILHLTVIESKWHQDEVEWLLNNGADKNAKDKNGRTPIFFAIQNDHCDIFKLLSGSEADITDEVKNSKIYKNSEIAEYLSEQQSINNSK